LFLWNPFDEKALNLQIIESVLTGESVPVTKTTEAIRKPGIPLGDRTNMAFMSTVVAKGRGKGIVVKTGNATEVGAISKVLQLPCAYDHSNPCYVLLGLSETF
jgi:magnesium-transporting ATPase (P-type)